MIALGPGQTYWTFNWTTLNICWVQNVQSVWQPCWALFTLVESCSVKFDRDQTFHWTNVERLNISFVFRDVECCSVRLTSPWTFVQFARAQWVIVSAKFSLVQQNVQHVWPPSNWTSLNNTQLCWTNVQCCSVKMFSTFDRGLIQTYNEAKQFCFRQETQLIIGQAGWCSIIRRL